MPRARRMVVLELRTLVPNKVSAEEAARIANMLLDIGVADAQDTLKQGIENADAQLATQIVWTHPTVKES